MASICVICNEALGSNDTSTVGKGRETLITASLSRNDGLDEIFEKQTPLIVHTDCRKNYTRPSSIKADLRRHSQQIPTSPTCQPQLRSHEKELNFKTQCLFCATNVSTSTKIPVKRRKTVYEARTLEFKENILLHASRRNYEWARSVSTRVHSVFDLVAAEAKYHEECRVDFFLRDNHKCSSKRGRPEDEKKK